MTDKAAFPETCWRCGASFQCGAAAGSDHCWCFDLTHIPLAEDVESCLCPACLKLEIESRSTAQQRN